MRDKIEGYQANVLFPTSTATQNIAQVSAKCYSRLTAVPFEFSCLATKRIPTDLDKSESSVKTLAPEFLAGKEWVSQVKHRSPYVMLSLSYFVTKGSDTMNYFIPMNFFS